IKSAGSKAPLRNLNGIIMFSNQVIQSKQLAMNVGESDLNLSFVLKNYFGMLMEDAARSAGRPAATVTLVSKQLRTADLMSESPSGTSTPQGSKKSEAPAGILPAIDIDANVAIDKLVTNKFTFTNARGSTSISNGKLKIGREAGGDRDACLKATPDSRSHVRIPVGHFDSARKQKVRSSRRDSSGNRHRRERGDRQAGYQ